MEDEYKELFPVCEEEEEIDIHDPKYKKLTSKPHKRSVPVDLLRTVAECEHFRLDADMALQYIKSKYKEVSKPTYYRIRAYLKSQDHVQQWLNDKAMVGFALAHKTQIERIERIISSLDLLLLEEIEKPTMVPRIDPETGNPVTDKEGNKQLVKNTNKDRNLILRIAAQIQALQIELDKLYNGNPIVSRIQAAIGENRQRNLMETGIVSTEDKTK